MNRFNSFLKDEQGTMSVETVVVFPLLLWAFAATFLFWDLYHAKAVSQRASFTIADTLSRELDVVDIAYMDGLNDVHTYLIQGQHDSRIRVTTIAWDDANSEFNVIWSHTPETNWAAHTDTSINALSGSIPAMAQGDVAIIVEAQVRYVPFMDVGIDPQLMESFVVTRPRFGPQLVWENADGTQIRYGSS